MTQKKSIKYRVLMFIPFCLLYILYFFVAGMNHLSKDLLSASKPGYTCTDIKPSLFSTEYTFKRGEHEKLFVTPIKFFKSYGY